MILVYSSWTIYLLLKLSYFVIAVLVIAAPIVYIWLQDDITYDNYYTFYTIKQVVAELVLKPNEQLFLTLYHIKT